MILNGYFEVYRNKKPSIHIVWRVLNNLIAKKWSRRDSNPRPAKETINLLHA